MQDLKKKIELQPLQEKNRESTEQKNGGGARSTWLEKKKLGQKNEEKKGGGARSVHEDGEKTGENRKKKGLFGLVPLQFLKVGDIPLQFTYFEAYHYNSLVLKKYHRIRMI
jgi:hypothetical protein